MSFSKNLIILQNERGITNYRLAKEIGVHCSTIQNWRDGKKPILEHAYAVSKFFGKTIDEMMS